MSSRALKAEVDNLKDFKGLISDTMALCFDTVSQLITETRNIISEADLLEVQDAALVLLQADYDFEAFSTKLSGLMKQIAENEDGSIPEKEFDIIHQQTDTEIVKEDSRYKDLVKVIETTFQESPKETVIDEDLAFTQEASIPIDPITKAEVKDPVKNTLCGHTYDRNSILEYMKMRPKAVCPFAGCKNRKMLKENDLVTNFEVKQLIQRRK